MSAPGGISKHTPESDAIIRRHYRAGVPARVTAAKLGMTRNAVIGRAFRLGLVHRGWLRRELARLAA